MVIRKDLLCKLLQGIIGEQATRMDARGTEKVIEDDLNHFQSSE